MLVTYLVAIFAFMAINAAAEPWNEANRGFIENQINNTLNQIAEKLAKQDPYIIPEITQSIINDAINVNFSVKDVKIGGISGFVATKLKASVFPPSIDVEVVFNKLTVTISEYDFDLLASFVRFYGKGALNLTVEHIVLTGSAAANLNPMAVKDLKIRFDLDTFNLNVTGLLHNEGFSQIISAVVSDHVPTYIHKYSDLIGELISKPLEDLINGQLNGSKKLNS